MEQQAFSPKAGIPDAGQQLYRFGSKKPTQSSRQVPLLPDNTALELVLPCVASILVLQHIIQAVFMVKQPCCLARALLSLADCLLAMLPACGLGKRSQ